MSLRRKFTVLSAAAAIGFLVTVLARPALHYARFHQLGWAPLLDVLGTAGMVLGCATLPVALLVLGQLRGEEAHPGGLRRWTSAIVLPLVLIAGGVLLGLGLDWFYDTLERGTRLWLRMSRDALLFAPAMFFAFWLWYRGALVERRA